MMLTKLVNSFLLSYCVPPCSLTTTANLPSNHEFWGKIHLIVIHYLFKVFVFKTVLQREEIVGIREIGTERECVLFYLLVHYTND